MPIILVVTQFAFVSFYVIQYFYPNFNIFLGEKCINISIKPYYREYLSIFNKDAVYLGQKYTAEGHGENI